jgi:lysophospholipase L1-like esterase
MLDASGMLQKSISNDGLHPNAAGYALIAPLAQAAVNAALAQPPTP